MTEKIDKAKFIIPVEVSIEVAWPLTDFAKRVDYRLTKIGLVSELKIDFQDRSSEDYTDLSCIYRDPNRKGPKCQLIYERSFQANEIKNFSKFTEQDSILKDGQTYVPINTLVQRLRNSNFGSEMLEYCTSDEWVGFDMCGKYFKVKTMLHPDTPQKFKEDIIRIIGISSNQLKEDYCDGHIDHLKFSSDETIEKVIQLWHLKIPKS